MNESDACDCPECQTDILSRIQWARVQVLNSARQPMVLELSQQECREMAAALGLPTIPDVFMGMQVVAVSEARHHICVLSDSAYHEPDRARVLRYALQAMTWQFGTRGTREAFEELGWDDPHVLGDEHGGEVTP